MKFEIKPSQKKKIKAFIGSYWKVGVVALALIILSILLIQFGGKKQEGGSDEKNTESVTSPDAESTSPQESAAEDKKALKQDVYPEIKKLMQQYFQTKFDCDVEALQKLVSPSDGYTVERLQIERYGKEGDQGYNELESYEVQNCYTKDGLLDGTYVVWVLYNMKYINADTPVPGLMRLYVCTDGNGSLYIYNGNLEEEVYSYIDEVSAMDDVTELKNTVNQRYREALRQDEKLNNIFDRMEAAAVRGLEADSASAQ